MIVMPKQGRNRGQITATGNTALAASNIALGAGWGGTSTTGCEFGVLFDARGPGQMPIQLNADQGFSVCNTVLMGTTGEGRWDFEMEWDEGVPIT